MKVLTLIIIVGIFLSLCLSANALYAGGRVYIGGYLGFPFYPYPYSPYAYTPYPYYYPYAYGYPYYPYQPPVYNVPEPTYYWYYCQDPQGYYPYVKSCPGGWMKVIPTPPQQKEEGIIK